MCDENLPPVINVGEGDEISLRVLDSKRGNKVWSFILQSIIASSYAFKQGNIYEVKPLRSSEGFRSSNLDEVFLLHYYLTIPLMTAAEGTLSVSSA